MVPPRPRVNGEPLPPGRGVGQVRHSAPRTDHEPLRRRVHRPRHRNVGEGLENTSTLSPPEKRTSIPGSKF